MNVKFHIPTQALLY